MELSVNTTNTVVTEKSTSRSATPSESSNDCRFNIIIFGIPEYDSGTSCFTRMAQDSANTMSTLQKIDSNLSESVVRDCFRLGKYKQNNSRPRPIWQNSVEPLMLSTSYPKKMFIQTRSLSNQTCHQRKDQLNRSF